MVDEKLVEGQETEGQTEAVENDGINIIEKEDGTYGLDDSKDSDSDPNGQTEDEQSEGNQEHEDSQSSVDDVIDPEYRGKSIHDIIEMHRNATKLFSKKANELAKYEKTASIDNLSRSELAEKIPLEDMRKKFIDLKVEQSSLDPDLDQEKFSSNVRLLAQLELDMDDKIREQNHIANERSSKNTETIKRVRESFKSSGIEISDDEFNEVSQIASEHYSEDGFISDRAFEHALVDKYGFENLQKFYSVKAKQSVRKEIETAQGKVSNTIGGKPGNKTKVINTRSVTSKREAEKIVASLSDKELDKILNRK